MSGLRALLQRVRSLEVVFSRNGDRLHVHAPKDTLTLELRAQFAAHKADLLALIDGGDEPFDVYDPHFVDIVLLWRDHVSKPKTAALELPGVSQ